ncbi:MAG: HipA domain-containing protein [Bacteroidales bacterium]|nr:HipA domain-containing protein [Bacteroidales bacterium]
MNKKKHIKALPILEYSGFKPKAGCISFAKKHQYFIVTDIAISGDAPKDFIGYYHFGTGRKSNPKTWPRYIAKHGHKHYSMEVISEYLLNRIGEELGFNMALSELAWLGGQIRFLSKYFLIKPKEQVLDHGADLYAGYLNDRNFVEEIEKQNKSPEFFTVQFTLETLKHFFTDDYEDLSLEFMKLLIFDALVGNNDRHFYNCGIIRNIKGKEKPVFSPIYDTARGLFWNEDEAKISKILSDKNRLNSFIIKYSNNSSPKIGWEGKVKLNHFEMVEEILNLPKAVECKMILNVCKPDALNRVLSMIDREFLQLISERRRTLIKAYLVYRHGIIRNILTLQND